MVRNLEVFKKLLMNKKFLHTMVKTLEGNPQKFGIPDRYEPLHYHIRFELIAYMYVLVHMVKLCYGKPTCVLIVSIWLWLIIVNSMCPLVHISSMLNNV